MIKIATVFSGIGSLEWALKRLHIKHELVFACDNGGINIEINGENYIRNHLKTISDKEEQNQYIDNLYSKSRKTNFVKKTYLSNYDLNSNNFLNDIRFIDGTKYKNKIDLFVGGSPCQSFSIMGHRKGLADTRGTLFYDFARLVNEIEPKVFIYENVQGMFKHDNGKTWLIIKETFESLGYKIYFNVLDAKDYGIPQTRRRLFVVGFKDNSVDFKFPKPIQLKYKLQDFLESKVKFGCFKSINGNISLNNISSTIEEKYFLSKAVLKHVMSPGTKNYYVEPKIDLEIARPLLSSMHKMHRAGIDNYVTLNGKIRKLTPRECLRLMGYDDNFKQEVSNTQMYIQAGNSIVVDVMMHLIKSILLTNALI